MAHLQCIFFKISVADILYILSPHILVPSKPGDIRFWNVTYASLDVEWDPPTTPNGRIINYELSYIEENPTSMLGKYNIGMPFIYQSVFLT